MRLVDLIKAPEEAAHDWIGHDKAARKLQVLDMKPTKAVVADMRAKLVKAR